MTIISFISPFSSSSSSNLLSWHSPSVLMSFERQRLGIMNLYDKRLQFTSTSVQCYLIYFIFFSPFRFASLTICPSSLMTPYNDILIYSTSRDLIGIERHITRNRKTRRRRKKETDRKLYDYSYRNQSSNYSMRYHFISESLILLSILVSPYLYMCMQKNTNAFMTSDIWRVYLSVPMLSMP